MADFGADIRIDFNVDDVMMRSGAACDEARFDLANQVLKDSNFYCKRDSGTMIESALTDSLPEQGIVQWVTPYASYQYEYPYASTSQNPHARSEWFDAAKSFHLNEWIDVYRESYNQAMGGGSH